MNEIMSLSERMLAAAKNCMIKNDARFLRDTEECLVRYMRHTSPKDYGISLQGKHKKFKKRG